jgi:hypothetical protein
MVRPICRVSVLRRSGGQPTRPTPVRSWAWAYDEVLGERVRDRLRGADGVARIAPDDCDAALAQPGTRAFDITGRPMRGWIMVAGETLDDDVLDGWIA